MLAQILKEMWVDPDVLEALSEDQRRILFLKMREEQVRRWTEREEKDEIQGRTRSNKGHSKSVHWLLGRDGEVSVRVIGEVDYFRSFTPPKSLHTTSRLQNTDLNNLLVDMHTVSVLTDRDNHHTSSHPSIQMQLSNDSDGSKESEEDHYSVIAEEEARVPAEDSSDSESDNSTDDLKEWGLYCSPHRHSNSSIPPQPQPQLSITENGHPFSRRAVVLQEENSGLGGRVAQLRRAFATSSPIAEPPVPTKPAHMEPVPKTSVR
ncbi:hypothetical protein UPYG_G00212520 [Umbra pygmaea]|uniref:Uncharacterized protein n=1 Tax=Umbra pygmaea TaxID=75934 RepID=A0ABD0WKZ0_UMBPY